VRRIAPSPNPEQEDHMSTSPELVRGVDFVGVRGRDLPRAAAFYGDTLGPAARAEGD
jgi:hypothetical protein